MFARFPSRKELDCPKQHVPAIESMQSRVIKKLSPKSKMQVLSTLSVSIATRYVLYLESISGEEKHDAIFRDTVAADVWCIV